MVKISLICGQRELFSFVVKRVEHLSDRKQVVFSDILVAITFYKVFTWLTGGRLATI